MSDENQNATTETQSSQTQPNEAATGADGGADATKSGGATDQGADDTSLLGGAKGGTGGEGEGGEKDAGDGKAPEGEDGDKDGPPEAYDLKVTTTDAEGKEVEIPIDTVLLEQASPVLKDLGLSNEKANKLAPLAVKVQERVLQIQNDEFAATKADWAKQVKADPELGGTKWPETETLAARALDTFGATEGSEFRKLLDESGLGNHPEMIRMFRRIGEKLGEDTDLVCSDASAPVKKSQEEILYPEDTPSKQGAK